MFYVMVILVGVVVFGITAVAAGQGGTLADGGSDQRRLVLPPGPMTAADLGAVRFPVAVRGYRMDQVDALLERLAHDIAYRDAHIAQLEGTDLGAASSAPDGTWRPEREWGI